MRQHLAALTTAILAVAGLLAAPQQAHSCRWRSCTVTYTYCSPVYVPCYPQPYPCYPPPYPCDPGRIVAASATIFVKVKPDAKLFVDGKLLEGSGPMRKVMTGTIPIGETLVVTLRADPPGKGKDDGGKDEGDDEEGPPKGDGDDGPKPPPGEDGGDKGGSITKKIKVKAFDFVEADLTK